MYFRLFTQVGLSNYYFLLLFLSELSFLIVGSIKLFKPDLARYCRKYAQNFFVTSKLVLWKLADVCPSLQSVKGDSYLNPLHIPFLFAFEHIKWKWICIPLGFWPKHVPTSFLPPWNWFKIWKEGFVWGRFPCLISEHMLGLNLFWPCVLNLDPKQEFKVQQKRVRWTLDMRDPGRKVRTCIRKLSHRGWPSLCIHIIVNWWLLGKVCKDLCDAYIGCLCA